MRQPVHVLQGLVTQFKPLVLVDLSAEQSLAGAIELDKIIKLAFFQFGRIAFLCLPDIGQQPVLSYHRIDPERPAFVGLYRVARGEHDARQWRRLFGVGAGFAGGEKQYGDGAVFHGHHRTKAHLYFGRTDPALARDEILHVKASNMTKGRYGRGKRVNRK